MKTPDFKNLSTDYTYADPKLLDRSTITREHMLFYADNCERLADFMERLPAEEHNQGRYANPCGTPACALGWAAFSNLFEGLQFGVKPAGYPGGYPLTLLPVINGGRFDWDKTGRYFFGRAAETRVFDNPSLSKRKVVARLRDVATVYREWLNPTEFSDELDF